MRLFQRLNITRQIDYAICKSCGYVSILGALPLDLPTDGYFEDFRAQHPALISPEEIFRACKNLPTIDVVKFRQGDRKPETLPYGPELEGIPAARNEFNAKLVQAIYYHQGRPGAQQRFCRHYWAQFLSVIRNLTPPDREMPSPIGQDNPVSIGYSVSDDVAKFQVRDRVVRLP